MHRVIVKTRYCQIKVCRRATHYVVKPRPQNLRVFHMYKHGVIHAARSMIAAGMAVAATMALNRPAVSDVATAL